MALLRSNFASLALVLAVLLVASACGGSRDSNEAGLYVDLPAVTADDNGPTTTTATGATTQGGENQGGGNTAEADAQLASVAQERFEEVESFYDDYLQQRANSIDRTDPLDLIDDLTTPAGRDDVVAALEYNDGLVADGRFSAVNALYLYSNVETVLQVDDDTILVIDCTEQHEINSLDQHLVFWVTNEVSIDVADAEMRVDSFTTTHNGYLEEDARLGCAPTSFRERAEATAAAAWSELSAWGQAADDRTDANLSEVIGEPLRTRVLEADVDGFETGEHVDNSHFTTVGLDTHGRLGASGPEGIVVRVESCHRFPDGRGGFDPATQSEVKDLDPGAQQALSFQVLIDPELGEERLDQVVSIEYLGDRCSS